VSVDEVDTIEMKEQSPETPVIKITKVPRASVIGDSDDEAISTQRNLVEEKGG